MKEHTFALLKDSLDEAQISVRTYDTKAQIVGVGYIFALNVIGDIGRFASSNESGNVITVVAAWILVILPIVLFGYVLYPKRKSQSLAGNDAYKHILFLHPERYGSSTQLIEAAEEADPYQELAHELIAVAALRESKRRRFVVALVSAGVTFAVLFASQVLISLGRL
ncbi:hypothetical protein [Qipengyuania flava]|uniref:hypothetical protein n=1 Tax=Qipengyuania flava TaxID=192812 RepID=UPI001C637A6B|nr:hypothetical protein [Qipengyuania flava]QYJ08336.1 hypothetical protein KUV82_06485 [Qipengyuania flava]